jgi:hypothetical protein
MLIHPLISIMLIVTVPAVLFFWWNFTAARRKKIEDQNTDKIIDEVYKLISGR